MEATLDIQEIIRQQFQPLIVFQEVVEAERRQLADAIEATTRYERRLRAAQMATGISDALSGGFLASIIILLVQGEAALGLGFLGPALAALTGSFWFRSRRIIRGA